MLAADNWCVKVDKKVYGPYTSQQMRKYAHEGRLSANSHIAPAGSRAWREARDEPAFANFFGYAKANYPAFNVSPVFGRRDAPDTQQDRVSDFRRKASIKTGTGVSNFIVIFDAQGFSTNRIEIALLSLGAAFRITDNVWSLTCELTAVGVRNAIAPYLSSRESIFVVDATRGRTSWRNLPPERHTKASAVYTAPPLSAKVNAR